MLLEIPRVLNARELEAVRGALETAPFIDGKLSAGMAAQRVKHNEEVDVRSQDVQQLNNLVMTRLVEHPTYRAAALPMKVASPYYARYSKGMSYGDHVDDPIMQADTPYRSDISITVFLSDKTDYEGGELVINTQYGEHSVKLAAGDAVMYPSSSVHHVNEITSGTRLVAVTWLQSLVREPAKRELLYDMYLVKEQLLREAPDDENTKRLDRSYVNLIRMWGDV
ncbi:Fe2+-dependent dioxygenase [Sulfuriflexus sp.]|uniref:Fe2+-dependent dioxygenase n=1 Tax=Sulfuriflexus sp. TaxID=2015443 RepID=UPI0028CDB5FE|nr:Fe2+-dependent dioxygenase [Sulfuriflexus sp.]MDT8404010.1 Fe2+-dependent dioxygenase [Sulfuriflexus sp.]